MKFNDKITQIIYFQQVIAINNFFLQMCRFIIIRPLHLIITERTEYLKIVYYINKIMGIRLNNS